MGRVLGLFESMMEPSPVKLRTVIKSNEGSPFETPRKRKLDAASDEDTPKGRVVKGTPRNDETPKRRRPEKDLFETPSFMRVISSGHLDAKFMDSPPVPQPRKKGLAKGLTRLMADLRKMQDEALDDDLDVLRDMENEGREEGPSVEKPKSLFPVSALKRRAADDLFGAVGGGEKDKDEEEEAEAEAEGEAEGGEKKEGEVIQPVRKQWKKKGLKRQTRRVKSELYIGFSYPCFGIDGLIDILQCVLLEAKLPKCFLRWSMVMRKTKRTKKMMKETRNLQPRNPKSRKSQQRSPMLKTPGIMATQSTPKSTALMRKIQLRLRSPSENKPRRAKPSSKSQARRLQLLRRRLAPGERGVQLQVLTTAS